MGIVDRLEQRMALGPIDDTWYYPGGQFYGGNVGLKTKSGANVSELNAMQLTVVWCCIRILSEDPASLPLHLYRRLTKKSGKYAGKERAVDHPLYALLHSQPNPEMTAMSFRETYNAHVLSWGNGYAEKEYGKGRIGRDRIEALWPITPNRVKPLRDERKQIKYRITMPTGYQNVELPRRQIFHTPGLSFDGIVGYSPIAAAREAIGLGMALEEYGELFFGQGTHPGVVVSHPGKLGTVAKDNLQRALTEAHSGLGKSHRLLLLEEAMKIEKIGIPNNEAQFLETRKLTNIDIGSRIYRLAPQMYGEFDKASTYKSAEQFAIDYVTKTLRAWLVRYEQAYNMAFLTPEEQKEYFFEHLVDGLLRGDIATRYMAYTKAKAARILTTNEIREMENRNPIEGGDKLDETPNMMPAGKTEPKEEDNQRIAIAYKRIFEATAQRIVNRETLAITKALKRDGFIDWLDKFYRDSESYIREQMLPVFESFFEALGQKNHDNGVFVDNFVQKYIERSKNELKRLISETKKDEIEGKITAKIDEWTQNRAVEIAEEEIKTGGYSHEKQN